MCDTETLSPRAGVLNISPSFLERCVTAMNINSLYIIKPEYFTLIKGLGGLWDDVKERPIVCLFKSTENDDLYWAIPMGNYNHRTPEAKKRIRDYMNYEKRDIRSCFYHLGRTTVKSIFFISQAIPIIDKYIDREYLGFDNNVFVISNPNLINTLNYKLARILKFESTHPNYFNQHITDIKNKLIEELVCCPTNS